METSSDKGLSPLCRRSQEPLGGGETIFAKGGLREACFSTASIFLASAVLFVWLPRSHRGQTSVDYMRKLHVKHTQRPAIKMCPLPLLQFLPDGLLDETFQRPEPASASPPGKKACSAQASLSLSAGARRWLITSPCAQRLLRVLNRRLASGRPRSRAFLPLTEATSTSLEISLSLP